MRVGIRFRTLYFTCPRVYSVIVLTRKGTDAHYNNLCRLHFRQVLRSIVAVQSSTPTPAYHTVVVLLLYPVVCIRVSTQFLLHERAHQLYMAFVNCSFITMLMHVALLRKGGTT